MRRDPPAIELDGLVEHIATDAYARTGSWPAWFPRMVETHYRGTIPQRLFHKANARRVELRARKEE